uniref:F-box protein At3g26010-like beta-propeller domain-containing protein n=1 Tax=Oryza nivara TaxID=4536 RepID=A0A0E0FLP7_ORYNI
MRRVTVLVGWTESDRGAACCQFRSAYTAINSSSVCRFKCVCKSWSSLFSDQYFCTKLPRRPAGLLYQDSNNGSIQIAKLPSGNSEIGTTLSFMPHHENLKLVDCSNGLILFTHGSKSDSPDSSHFIVCNPATQEWIALPDTCPRVNGSDYIAMLAFNPSSSCHFFVFNFQKRRSPHTGGFVITEVEIFSSEDFTWIADDAFETEIMMISMPHVLLHGILYLRTVEHSVFAIETPHMYKPWIHRWTFELPGDSCPMNNYIWGCLGESSGILHYMQPNYDGCWLNVWRLESRHQQWSMTHSLSMIDAFGRGTLVHGDPFSDDWSADYGMLSFDLEREIVFLHDRVSSKVLSYSIRTGKLCEMGDLPRNSLYYVPYWRKFPVVEEDQYWL